MHVNGAVLDFLVLQSHSSSSTVTCCQTATYKMALGNNHQELCGMAGFCTLTYASVQKGQSAKNCVVDLTFVHLDKKCLWANCTLPDGNMKRWLCMMLIATSTKVIKGRTSSQSTCFGPHHLLSPLTRLKF